LPESSGNMIFSDCNDHLIGILRDMEKTVSLEGKKLAVIGGNPLFSTAVHVGRPNVGDPGAFMTRINEILERRWFTNDGPVVKEFERRIAEMIGVKHCIAMCNATVALEIAIRALGLRGEVIVPSFTFIATAHALQWQEITPVFADVDPLTHNIDPASVERLVTPRTTGIIGVHLWGRPCDVDALERIAQRHRLRVMYDAAHALGCSRGGKMVGGFGDAEVFSFHATKVINSLEGGMVATNDDDLAGRIRLMKNFGFTQYDCVDYIGTNGKMNEISAAMGLTCLESIEEIVASNRRNYECYGEQLKELPGISLIRYDESEENNYHYVIVEVDPAISPLSRDELIAVLHAENVLARKYFWPGCHRMQPYRSLQPSAPLWLGQTERLAGRVLALPNGRHHSRRF
jgi:dTDP-4-amino-4,6-dideoxygalactose transaminase